MPGIVGIIGENNTKENASDIQRMTTYMMHEPFYKSGTYINETLGLWIGWVTHENSFSDCMPMWNETHDICLIFTGEDFPDSAVTNYLRTQGHQFDSEDASYLVHLYEEMGDKFFEILNGWFSGVLVNLRENIIILFNDRYGLSRLNYHEKTGTFYFASEAKCLLGILPHLRSLDKTSFGEFFTCGSALQNRTLFSDISLLPVASVWTFRPHQSAMKEIYFKKETWEKQERLPESEYYEKLKETFLRILPKYFRSKQKISLSLTGGWDSRMIIAAASCPPFSLSCHTFGGLYRECADVRLGKKIAKTCQQSHEVLYLDPTFFSEFPTLAAKTIYLTDGTMDVSGSVGLFVNKMARELAPVRLTGNYGGEILRNIIVFRANNFFAPIFDKAFLPHLDNAVATFSNERNCHPSSFVAFKQVPWHHYNRLSMEQTQLTMRSPYLDNELVKLSYQAPTDISVNRMLMQRIIVESTPSLAGFPSDRGFISRLHFVPFGIRHWCEEFMPRAEYAYDYGMPQWLAKIDNFLSPLHLEKLFLGRQKYYHFRIWYHNELSKFVKDVILDPRSLSRPYLNGKYVEKIVMDHVKGIGNHTLEIHNLLGTELIQRQLIEQR